MSSSVVVSVPVTLSVALSSDPSSLIPTPASPYPPCCLPALTSAPDFWTDAYASAARQQLAPRTVLIETKSVANRNPSKGLNEDRIGLWREGDGDSVEASGAWCVTVCDGHGGSDCAE